MNRRDIFVMIFFCLDEYWEKNKTEELGDLCSDLNPFLWEGEQSADPAYWINFCEEHEDSEYTLKEGFEFAKTYVKSLNNEQAKIAMESYSLDDWETGYSNYLLMKSENY